MSDPIEPDWTARERRALAELSLEATPPRGLEERVLAQLAARPARRRRTGRGWRTLGMIAAALVVFVGGWWAGARSGDGPGVSATAGDRYLLLLREDASYDRSGSEAERVAEYRDWAMGLRREGRLEMGEKLAEERLPLPDGAAAARVEGSPETVAGFFIIRAVTPAQAASIASTCPHLRHGGRIELRRIVDT
jgi:hypothetical protein